VSAAIAAAPQIVTAPGPLLGGYRPLDALLAPDMKLQTALEQVVASIVPGATFTGNPAYAFAVVDLTDTPETPSYAGWSDCRQLAVGSLAKLLPMYAAFLLRSDLRCLSRERGISTMAALEVEAKSTYTPFSAKDGAGRALKIEPMLSDMFDITGPGQVDFKTDQTVNLSAEHSRWEARQLRPIQQELAATKMFEQLYMMVRMSDNASASAIVQALGFPYLWAVVFFSQLYRPAGWPKLTRLDRGTSSPGGLYLGVDYTKRRWSPPAALTPPWPLQATNARGLAVLLAKLVQGTLLDDEAQAQMLEIMRVESSLFVAWQIAAGMKAAGWTVDGQVVSRYTPLTPPLAANRPLSSNKVGIWEDELSDVLVVRESRPGISKPITAVLIALTVGDPSSDVIKRFGQEMARQLETLHKTGP
jgi:hypothetical protein